MNLKQFMPPSSLVSVFFFFFYLFGASDPIIDRLLIGILHMECGSHPFPTATPLIFIFQLKLVNFFCTGSQKTYVSRTLSADGDVNLTVMSKKITKWIVVQCSFLNSYVKMEFIKAYCTWIGSFQNHLFFSTEHYLNLSFTAKLIHKKVSNHQ